MSGPFPSSRSRWALIAFFFLCLPASALPQTPAPRIEPAGIDGALLLCGRGDVSAAAIARFLDLAGGSRAKIVVLANGAEKSYQPIVEQIKAGVDMKKIPAPQVLKLSADQEKSLDRAETLADASAVWLAGGSAASWQAALKHNPLEKDCQALLKRGGVIATSGAGTEIAVPCWLGDAQSSPPGLNLLPDGVIEVRHPAQPNTELKGQMKNFQGRVGYGIGLGSALLVRGRTLSAVGAGKVTIYLAGNHLAPRAITLAGKAVQDLTSLRRAARDRKDGFPPAKPQPPIVEHGTLVIVGGGGSPDNLHQKFVELAGGKGKANIVILPTANPEPLPKRDVLMSMFRKAGAKKVTVLKGRTLAEVESKEFLDTLREATGLWFDGGRQWRYVDCYENTLALPLMFDVLKRGGVIGGTSAGATIQGEYLCRGGVFNNFDIRYEGYERGLGFLKGVAIDQHFTQRKRQADMTALMKIYPQYLGIGLDEATAIIVQGSSAEVIGQGKAHFYDTRRKIEKGQPDHEALSAGERYDLKTRKSLASR